MRVIKHALLSLLRKPTKAIMIFTILVLVFGLVFTGIIIQNSVRESKEYVRIQLGATVQYAPNYIKAMNDELDYEEYSQMVLSESVAKTIAEDPRVKQLYLIKNPYALGKDIKSGRSFDEETSDKMISSDSEYVMETYLNMTATNTTIPLDFETNKLTLSKGSYFTDEQQLNGENVTIISAELASQNSYNIGDKFTTIDFNDNSEIEFEIIGIYDGADTYSTDTIYIPYLTADQFFYGEEDNVITNVYFLLTDPLDVSDFISDHTDKLPSEYTNLTANDAEYKKLTRPLDLMELITSILIWVVFGAGALIVLAIVTIFVRDRKFEIGLLLASGESRLKIITQFVFEIFIIAIIAFIVSTGASQLSSKFVASWIIENQLVNEDDSNSSYEDMYFSQLGGNTSGDVNMESIANDFNVSIEFGTIINLLLISIGILIFAASIPLIIIMSYKPREALQD